MDFRLLCLAPIAALVLPWGHAQASTLNYAFVFESDEDAPGGEEVAVLGYGGFEDLLAHEALGPSVFTPLNVSPDFSIAGTFFDGNFHFLFESDADAPGGEEVAVLSYGSFEDLLAHEPLGPSVFTPLNVSPDFSIAGVFAFDAGDPDAPPGVIPLPAGVWLLATAIAGLVLSARRREPVA